MLALLVEFIFLPPSMAYISIIYLQITLYNFLKFLHVNCSLEGRDYLLSVKKTSS